MSEHELNAIRWYVGYAAAAVLAVVLIIAGWNP